MPRRKVAEDEEIIVRRGPKFAAFLVENTPDLTPDQGRFLVELGKLVSPEPAAAAMEAGLHPDMVYSWLTPGKDGQRSTVHRLAEYIRQVWLSDHEAILSLSCTRRRETRGKATPALAILNAHHPLYTRGNKQDVLRAMKEAKKSRGAPT